MKDEFLKHFGWLTETLKNPISDFFEERSEEYAIIERLKEGWGKRDTIELLKGLTAEFGDKAGQTVEKYLEMNIRKDWAEVGRRKAREGSEIEDFLRALWEPLQPPDFEYDVSKENGVTTFCVKKCPIFELAERTGMHDWLYHMACATDFYTTPSFSPKIGFERTKTLMEGHDHCNHQYFYR